MNIDHEEYIKALYHALELHEKFVEDFERVNEVLGKKEEGLIEICDKINEMIDGGCKDEEIFEMNEKAQDFLSEDFINEMNNKIYELRTRYDYLLELRTRVDYLGKKTGINPELDLLDHHLSIISSKDLEQMSPEEIEDKLYSDIELKKEMMKWQSYGLTLDEAKEIMHLKSDYDLNIGKVSMEITLYDYAVSIFRIKKHEDLLFFEELDGERRDWMDMFE